MARPAREGTESLVGVRVARRTLEVAPPEATPQATPEAPPILRVSAVQLGDESFLLLAGELDMCSGEELRMVVSDCLRGRPKSLSIDLSAVEFCDCAGLRALQWVGTKAADAGAAFRLLSPPATVVRLFGIVRADDMIAACIAAPPSVAGHPERDPDPR